MNTVTREMNYIEDCFRNKDKRLYYESENMADVKHNQHLLKVFFSKLYSKHYLDTKQWIVTFDECFCLKDSVARKTLEEVQYEFWIKESKINKRSVQ